MPHTGRVQLSLLIHGSWYSILTIPVGDFHLFTTCPLRWLMFLGFTIYGREGILKADKEGPELDDYTTDAGSLKDHYYYVAQVEPRLVAARVTKDRVSDAWTHTHTSQEDFRAALIERDRTCVVSNQAAEDCDASHCLPHSKGDEYIGSLTEFRGNTPSDVIDDISDARNGLLLLHQIHRYVGRGDSAFIMTPSFAMDKNHVPDSPQSVTSSSKRMTLQHFATTTPLVQRYAPHNKDARPPADWSTWPPPIILDVLYGNAAIKRWATQTTADLIHKWSKADYYKQQIMEQDSAQAKAAQTAKQVAEHLQRAEERVKRGSRAGGGQEDPEMDTLDMILYLSRLSGPRYLLEPTSPPSETSPEDVSREKVRQWLQSNSL